MDFLDSVSRKMNEVQGQLEGCMDSNQRLEEGKKESNGDVKL